MFSSRHLLCSLGWCWSNLAARMFLENKEEVGKVDEIFGPINSFYFSVKPSEGMKATFGTPRQLLAGSNFRNSIEIQRYGHVAHMD